MSEPKRLHPISAVVNFLKQLKELIIPFFVFVVFGSKNGSFQFIMSIVVIIIILILGIISWLRFTYRLEEGELRIEYGVFIRKKRYIPFERIQSLDLSEGILQRPFGLVKVKVETAGSSKGEAEAVLTAITKEEANFIQHTLFSAKNKIDEQSTELFEKSSQEEDILYKITPRELLLLASTSGGAGVVFSAFFAFVFQFEEIIPYERLFRGLEDIISSGVILVSILVFIGFLFAWVVALIGTMIKYAEFTVKKLGEDLIITRGLLEKRQLTIPLHRIQAIRITENVIRQPLGFGTVYLESAGGSAIDQDSARVMLLPIIKKDRVAEILSPYLKQYVFEANMNRAPGRALKRYLLRGILFSLPAAAIPIIFFRPWGYFGLMFVLISMVWAVLRFKDTGWSIADLQLTLRYRTVNKTTVYMNRNRIQSLRIQESYFQRRKELGTISAVVMSGTGGTGGTVVDLDKMDIQEIYKWYSYTK
ncbi:PH domain-containing protein [Bacillus sp. S/N-304-OC-R1]|uniref:PH domain-containing protein n=1 Tax=Bacillus sp. S/N-304-OC-R1 TaxID=2758034 RepID=UPI001C8E9E93|nr:PH domain-containing protein [Bacillus sp. S/N-304-OC-R1]MBY0121168.1 PH domain-containing protein [Bacillus sp. S/N-304-OC-R1]